MLKIHVPAVEMFDSKTETFIKSKECDLQLEHSLVSLSKWESKWNKPFLSKEQKTQEETIDYIRCMTITQNVNPTVYNALSAENIEAINRYISASMTATTFSKETKASREIITSELIYYWMISLNIPMECQKWHLNRLLTLIRVCDVKNTPPKKMSQKEIAGKYASLNAARRAQMHSKG